MTKLDRASGSFRAQAQVALADSHTQGALDAATARLRGNRIRAWEEQGDIENGQQLRNGDVHRAAESPVEMNV